MTRETLKYRWLVKTAQETFESRGYSEIMPNLVEETEVFSKCLGLDSDIVAKVWTR